MCDVKNLTVICLLKLLEYWDRMIVKGQVSEEGGTCAKTKAKIVL
jgi:hypothetical protein